MRPLLLLEAFLLRLSRHADAEALLLRGGMRLRQALRAARPASDIDLVWREPRSSDEVRLLVREVLATPGTDGVRFDAERFRVDDVVVGAERLGTRVVAAGWADGSGADFTIDIHRPLPLGPAPCVERLRTSRGEGHLMMCAPETMIARKLLVTSTRGPERFRAKDVDDVHRLLTEWPFDRDALAHAFEATFVDAQRDLRALIAPDPWVGVGARARWRRHARTPRIDLTRAVGEIGDAIAPYVRRAG